MNMKYILLLIFLHFTFILCEPPTTLLMGTQDKTIHINNDCEQYQISTNFKHITIDINKIKNIEKIVITDKMLDNCNAKECSMDSNICQSMY